MQTPLEITFQGIEKSAVVEGKIAAMFRKLERHFDRITRGRVVVAAAHRHAHKGKIYQIKIEIGIPDRAPVIVTHEPEIARAHDDLVSGIGAAFEKATRRLNDTAMRLRGGAKMERGRRRPAAAADEL